MLPLIQKLHTSETIYASSCDDCATETLFMSVAIIVLPTGQRQRLVVQSPGSFQIYDALEIAVPRASIAPAFLGADAALSRPIRLEAARIPCALEVPSRSSSAEGPT